MIDFLYAVFGFIVAIGLLTSIHEFGHFIVARMLRVKVLRFSVGFGKPIFSTHDKQGTEYVIASIPLGGYVKMLDENEGEVPSNERHRAFNNKSVFTRMMIIAAGPIFNLIFAIIAYWLVFMIGISSLVPVLGVVPKGSVADIAGLHRGDEIISIDNSPVKSWEDISVILVGHLGAPGYVNVETKSKSSGEIATHAINLSNWSPERNEENILKTLGLETFDPVIPVVGKVMPGYPAEAAGLKSDDHITHLEGIEIDSRAQLIRLLHDKYDESVQLTVLRKGESFNLLITPVKKVSDGGDIAGFIGIQFKPQPWPKDMIRVERYGPVDSLYKAVGKTRDYTVLTFQFLEKMITGKMALHYVAGPISIAKFAGQSVVSGIEYFLGFLALVSVSLGVLNMLPIPVLDGGHFLYCCIELVRGKKLSRKAMEFGHTLGFVVLAMFMVLAFYNDILRIMQ